MRFARPAFLSAISLAAVACAHQDDRATAAPAASASAATFPASSAAPASAASAGGSDPTAATTPPGVPSASAAPLDTKAVAGATELAVGKPAPDFTAHDQDGKPVSVAANKGKYVIVYFYPKDETPGCTKEACSFRDAWNDLQKKGVVLIGVSADSDESHRAFAKNHQLPFQLVSDPKGDLAAKFGVPKTVGFLSRESFVIAPDGTVKKIYRKVDVATHAAEIASDVQSS